MKRRAWVRDPSELASPPLSKLYSSSFFSLIASLTHTQPSSISPLPLFPYLTTQICRLLPTPFRTRQVPILELVKLLPAGTFPVDLTDTLPLQILGKTETGVETEYKARPDGSTMKALVWKGTDSASFEQFSVSHR